MKRVEAASRVFFGKEDPHVLDADTLRDAVAEAPRGIGEVGQSVVDVLVALKLEQGFGAARRTLSSGGVYINNAKVESVDRVIEQADVLAGGVVLVRKGRKNLAVLEIDK